MHDLRYALRTLRNRPAFGLVGRPDAGHRDRGEHRHLHGVLPGAVAAVALPRIGSAGVRLERLRRMGTYTNVSIPDYLDRRNGAPAIEDAALIAPGTATVSDRRAARAGGLGSGHRLVLHDARPRRSRLGRGSPNADDSPGAVGVSEPRDLAVALRRRIPVIVGRTVRINAERACDPRRAARRFRAAGPGRRVVAALRLHAAADVRSGTRRRIQRDVRPASWLARPSHSSTHRCRRSWRG